MEFHILCSQTTIPFVLITLAFFPFLYVISLIRTNHRSIAGQTRKAPPEAGGSWPLIGHLHRLGGAQPPHVTLGNMADKYGPIFSIRLGVHKTLIVSSWEMAKECFTANDKAFANRPKALAYEVLGYNYAMIAFSPYGSYWSHVRKIAFLELLSSHRFEMLKHIQESEVKAAIKETYNCWLSSKKNQIGGPHDEAMKTEMKSWLGDILLNILFKMIIGKRFVDEKIEERETTRKILRDAFDLSGSFPISDAVPFLRWLDLDGKEKAMKKTAKKLDQLAQLWLEEHKYKRSGSAVKRDHDFVDALVSIFEKDQVLEGHDADTSIKATSLSLILAATDTTTGTLTWALALLLNNHEALNKAQHELDTQIGRERLVMESDLKKLEYLDAILKETMRLYPPAPLNVPHESMEDCIVGGYHVPADTTLLTNISKIHRDSRVYSDPMVFLPERFLGENKGLDVRGRNFELIPFGVGRRMCPGISFALHSMKLTLANLLHAFHMVTPDDEPVDMCEQIGLTNIKASPLHVLLTPRLSPQVYE